MKKTISLLIQSLIALVLLLTVAAPALADGVIVPDPPPLPSRRPLFPFKLPARGLYSICAWGPRKIMVNFEKEQTRPPRPWPWVKKIGGLDEVPPQKATTPTALAVGEED